MGFLVRASDTIYAFRFMRLLTTPWNKTGAFKAGLIDDQGAILRKPETPEDRSVYNLFHRLVFNLKRLLNKLPFGKKTISSYLAALYLIKEETGLSDAKLSELLYEITGTYADVSYLNESRWYLDDNGRIQGGSYSLLHDLPLNKTGEILALKDSRITIKENAKPVGSIFGVNAYHAFHHKTKQMITLTHHDIIQ